MNSAYLFLILILLILMLHRRRKKRYFAIRKILSKGEHKTMIEAAKRLAGHICTLYMFDGNHIYDCTIREVLEHAVITESKNGTLNTVNPDFIIRIEEKVKKQNPR